MKLEENTATCNLFHFKFSSFYAVSEALLSAQLLHSIATNKYVSVAVIAQQTELTFFFLS